MTTHFGFDRLRRTPSCILPRPRVLIEPDNETFRANTISTYNVIEAAATLGVRKIVIGLQRDHIRGLFCRRREGFQKLSARRRNTTPIQHTLTGFPKL